MALTQTQVSMLYVAIFNRASEGEGNKFWQNEAELATGATAMLGASDAISYFGSSLNSNKEFIEHIYLNTLNKTSDGANGTVADAKGIQFWVDLLEIPDEITGVVKTRGEVVAGLVEAAVNPATAGNARDQFLNRVAVSDHAAAVLDKAPADYQNVLGFDAGLPVDHTETSEIAADLIIDNLGSSTFSLTENPDTATANIFNAGRVWDPSGDDQLNSLNDDDVLTGTGEDPTLNVNFINDIDSGDMDIMPTLNNIETVNVKFSANAAQTIDFQDTTGLKYANADRIDGGASVTFDNIQSVLERAKVSNSNDNTTSNVIFDHSASVLNGTADEVALTLSNVQMNGIRIDGVTQGYETINISSEGDSNTFNLLTAESVQTLNVTGDQSFRVGGTNSVLNGTIIEASTQAAGLGNVAGSLTKLDASALTASLTYHIGGEINANADADGSAVALEIIGGTADDSFVLVNGNNIDAVAANTDTIDGKEGTNSLLITGGTNQVVAAPAAGANLKNIQDLEIRTGQDAAAVADFVTVDADAFDSLASITVRNEGQNNFVSTAENMTVNLNDLTVAQAAAITVLHGTTGNNGLVQNIIVSDVKTNTAADTLGITLNNGINTDVRFNLQLTDTAGTTFENITITDSDSEDNTIQLNSFTNHSGAITVTGGEAGDFMNLDATANAYTKVTTGATGDATTVDAAAVGGFGQDATTSDRDTAISYSLDTKAGGELLVAATITATDYAGDFIARVGTKDQTINLGAGNDTIIFADRAGTTNATAGLNILDKVDGGAGNDTIVLDGTGNVSLGASEWTNLKGIDAIQIAGLAGSTARVLITDQLVDQTDAGNRITVINNDGDLDTNVEIASTIDLRQMSATNGITFIGANGAGENEASNIQTIIIDDVTANGSSILNGGDRDVLTTYSATGTDSGINGAGVAAVAYGTQAVADADWLANIAGNDDGNNNVLAYHATTATNEITVGDLTNTQNFSTLTFDNDTSNAVVYSVTLNDAVADQLVDASHAANTVAVETLTLTANGSATVPLATGAFNLNASAVTAKFDLQIDGGNGNDVIALGAGSATYVVNDGIASTTHTAGNDTMTGFTTGVDSLDLDISDYTLTGGAGDDLANGNYYEGASGGLTGATAYDVIVLTGASYATVAAAEIAVSATSTSATNGFVIFHNSATSQVEMYLDVNLSANSGAMTATDIVMAFTDLDDATDAGVIGAMFAMGDFNLIA